MESCVCDYIPPDPRTPQLGFIQVLHFASIHFTLVCLTPMTVDICRYSQNCSVIADIYSLVCPLLVPIFKTTEQQDRVLYNTRVCHEIERTHPASSLRGELRFFNILVGLETFNRRWVKMCLKVTQ